MCTRPKYKAPKPSAPIIPAVPVPTPTATERNNQVINTPGTRKKRKAGKSSLLIGRGSGTGLSI